MFEINESYMDIFLNVALSDKVNLFIGDSGTGKTFLFSAISKIPFLPFDTAYYMCYYI